MRSHPSPSSGRHGCHGRHGKVLCAENRERFQVGWEVRLALPLPLGSVHVTSSWLGISAAKFCDEQRVTMEPEAAAAAAAAAAATITLDDATSALEAVGFTEKLERSSRPRLLYALVASTLRSANHLAYGWHLAGRPPTRKSPVIFWFLVF
jgi:hypothetical protein